MRMVVIGDNWIVEFCWICYLEIKIYCYICIKKEVWNIKGLLIDMEVVDVEKKFFEDILEEDGFYEVND